MTEHLIKDRSYFVYKNDWHFNTRRHKSYIRNVKMFIANFKETINQTIIFKDYISTNTKYYKNNEYSIPLHWIVRCKTLDNITCKKLPLPIELVEIIDYYL